MATSIIRLEPPRAEAALERLRSEPGRSGARPGLVPLPPVADRRVRRAGRQARRPSSPSGSTNCNIATGFTAGGRDEHDRRGQPLEKQALAEPFSTNDLSICRRDRPDVPRAARAEPARPVAAYQLFCDQPPLEAPVPPAVNFNPLDRDTSGFLDRCAAAGARRSRRLAARQAGRRAAQLPPETPTGTRPSAKRALGSPRHLGAVGVGRMRRDRSAPPGRPAAGVRHAGASQGARRRAASCSTPTPTRTASSPGRRSTSRRRRSLRRRTDADVEPDTLVPGHVRFRAIAAPRFWDFETSELALPSVKTGAPRRRQDADTGFSPHPRRRLVHRPDAAAARDVSSRVDALVVTDVFGAQVSVARADALTTAPGPTRWSLFTP